LESAPGSNLPFPKPPPGLLARYLFLHVDTLARWADRVHDLGPLPDAEERAVELKYIFYRSAALLVSSCPYENLPPADAPAPCTNTPEFIVGLVETAAERFGPRQGSERLEALLCVDAVPLLVVGAARDASFALPTEVYRVFNSAHPDGSPRVPLADAMRDKLGAFRLHPPPQPAPHGVMYSAPPTYLEFLHGAVKLKPLLDDLKVFTNLPEGTTDSAGNVFPSDKGSPNEFIIAGKVTQLLLEAGRKLKLLETPPAVHLVRTVSMCHPSAVGWSMKENGIWPPQKVNALGFSDAGALAGLSAGVPAHQRHPAYDQLLRADDPKEKKEDLGVEEDTSGDEVGGESGGEEGSGDGGEAMEVD
jgi:hypothetical protein